MTTSSIELTGRAGMGGLHKPSGFLEKNANNHSDHVVDPASEKAAMEQMRHALRRENAEHGVAQSPSVGGSPFSPSATQYNSIVLTNQHGLRSDHLLTPDVMMNVHSFGTSGSRQSS